MLIEGMFHLNFSLSSSFVSWSTLPFSVKQVDIDCKEEGRNEAKTLKKKINQMLVRSACDSGKLYFQMHCT